MKYLITDPCYIVPDNEWHDFLDSTEYGDNLPEGGYKVEGVGVIKDCSGTANGDGSLTYKGQEIGVDAGMVCRVELEEGFDLAKQCKERGYFSTLGVVVDNGDESYEVYGLAMGI